MMPTVWMDSSLGGMVVPLWPGHLVPGSLCRGQHPPPRLPQPGQGWCRGMHGVSAPRPRRGRHPRSRPRPVSSGRGWGFPLVPRSPGFCRWKSKRRKISSWHYESGKRQKKKGKKKKTSAGERNVQRGAGGRRRRAGPHREGAWLGSPAAPGRPAPRAASSQGSTPPRGVPLLCASLWFNS